MHLGRLQIFFHAADTLNFSQAAARLNVTQPAVSAQIRVLEENVGVKLFARLGKKLVLTEAGEVLLGYTRRIFRLRDEAETVMNDLRLVRRGTLKVGTTHTYAGHIMPPLLKKFQAAFPQVSVVLHEGSSLEVVKKLKTLAVEVAVVAYPGPVKRITYEFFKKEDLILITHPGHELAEAKNVPILRLAEEPFVMREKGSGTRRVVSDLFRRHRLTPRIVFETSNAEVIKEQVADGVGLSFLTRSAVQGDIDMGRLAPVFHQGHPLRLDINTAVLEGHELSLPARAFLDLLAETNKYSSVAQGL
ncbi:MAG: LysR family transcriptional regulator [Thermodesulfobacteriota bacterium]